MSTAFLHALDCVEPHTDAVWGVACAADKTVSISADGTIKAWDTTSGQVFRSLPPHTLGLVSLSLAPTGKQALFNSLEGCVTLWDVDSGEKLGQYESYSAPDAKKLNAEWTEPTWSVSLHPSGKAFAATGGGGNLTIHSTNPEEFGKIQQTLQSGRSKYGMHCGYSPDGRRVAMASETGQVYLFDAETANLAATFTSHAMNVRSFAWSPDNQLLVTASEDRSLVIHDVRVSSTASAVASLAGHSSWVMSASISPDCKYVLSGSSDKTIKVWDISARAAVSTIVDNGEVWSVAWKNSGSFVSGGSDGVVRWWRSAGTG